MSYQDTRYSAKKFVAEKLLLISKSALTKEEEDLIDELVSNVWKDAVSYDAVWDSD